MSRTRIHEARVAFASDGSIVANVHGFAGETDQEAVLHRAIDCGEGHFHRDSPPWS
jgi:hypothetical protein